MTYELAKQLKDAGFSQTLFPLNLVKIRNDKTGEQIDVYLPTLSELISACGEAFDSLILDRPTKKWRVSWWYDHLNNDEPDKILENTPEEAVARLWLALNQKPDG